jgi:hypothetical protein
MAGNKRRGQLINLAQRRRRRMAEALVEARGRMIEAEHALFVALRLAGHEHEPVRASATPGRPIASRCTPSGPVLRLFPGGKRAA